MSVAFERYAGRTSTPTGLPPDFAPPLVSPILVGRDSHVGVLQRCLEQLATGRGHVIVLHGEAGTGKTRLVSELRVRADAAAVRVLQGSCYETDRLLPYAPFLELLRSLDPADPLVRSALSATEDVGTLEQFVPHLVGDDVGPRTGRLHSDDGELAKRRIFETIDSLLGELAGSQLVAIVEDLHWADALSAELVALIARRTASRPLLLVLTCRPDEAHAPLRRLLAELERERLASELVVRPLEPHDIDRMLRAIFEQEGPLPPDFLQLVARLTEGNPFFIEEILRSLRSSGDVYVENGRWSRKSMPELRVPRSVREAVSQRMAQLSPAAADVARLAAVAGRRFGFALLAALSDLDEPALINALKDLIGAGLLVEESADQFAFRHALTREAVYWAMLARERRHLHHRVVELVQQLHTDEPASLDDHLDLTYHFHEAGAWPEVVEFGVRAGQRALDLFAPQAAVEQFSRAIDAAAQLGETATPEVHRMRGLAHEMLGAFDAALADFEIAVELSRSTEDVATAWRTELDLGALWSGRDYARSADHVRLAMDLAPELDDPAAVAQTLNRLGTCQLHADRVEEALRSHTDARAIFERLGHARDSAETLALLGAARVQAADPAQAAEDFARAMGSIRELDDRKLSIAVSVERLALGGTYLLDLQRGAAPVEDASEAPRLANEVGWRTGEAYACSQLALWLAPRGEYARALELADRALSIATDLGHAGLLAVAQVALSALYLDMLNLPLAAQHADLGASFSQQIGASAWKRIASALRCRVALAAGDATLAAKLLHDVPEADGPLTLSRYHCALARAELALQQNHPESGLEMLNTLRERLGPSVRGVQLEAEALRGLQRYADGEACLRVFQQMCLERGFDGSTWRIHRAEGQLYASQRRGAEAERAFETARQAVLALAENVPNGELRETFVGAALASMPAPRPTSERRAARERFGGLTSREREVAALIAQGLSNRAVADELVLGERTVESYVSSILNKLGYTSRVQIAAWAVGVGLARSS